MALSSPALCQTVPEGNALGQLQLDLGAKTEGFLFLPGKSPSDPAQLQADFRVRGRANAFQWNGFITARNLWIDLPCGPFFLPEARLWSDAGAGEQLSFTAYGLTRAGFCVLEQEGALQEATPWFDAPAAGSGITAADLVLALAAPAQTTANARLLAQMPAWIRQNTLFPVPPLGWIIRRTGSNDSGSLGFYGNPWSASLLPSSPLSSKN
jgi:hypothetical protein